MIGMLGLSRNSWKVWDDTKLNPFGMGRLLFMQTNAKRAESLAKAFADAVGAAESPRQKVCDALPWLAWGTSLALVQSIALLRSRESWVAALLRTAHRLTCNAACACLY